MSCRRPSHHGDPLAVLSEDAGWIVRESILMPTYALDKPGAHEDTTWAQIEQPGTRISLGECVESECPVLAQSYRSKECPLLDEQRKTFARIDLFRC